MINNNSLIIHLIKQDLEYEKLMYEMRKIGFYNYSHSLDLATPVAVLMGLQEYDIPEEWMKIYERCITAYCQYGDTTVEKNAQECYEQFHTFVLNSYNK